MVWALKWTAAQISLSKYVFNVCYYFFVNSCSGGISYLLHTHKQRKNKIPVPGMCGLINHMLYIFFNILQVRERVS